MPAPIDKKAIWLAGFFDGEGAVMICKFKRHDTLSHNPQYQLRLSVVNTDLPTLEYIKEEFGGRLNNGHGTYSLKNMQFKSFKPVYEWCAADKTAARVLKRIGPYLVLKKGRAKAAIEFQESRYAFRKQSGMNPCLTSEEIGKRETMYLNMKSLNSKGTTAKHQDDAARGIDA